MGIKSFIISLLVLSITLFIATVAFEPLKVIKTQNKPDITFINSIMYELDNKEVSQIVKSKKAYHYKTKDELFNATVVLKSKNNKNNIPIFDTISASFIEITPKFLKFRGNVNYNKSSGTSLQTQSLDYDRITKHLTGHEKFIAFHEGNKLKGNSLSIEKNKTVFKSTDNSPLKLDIIMKKE